MRMVLSRYSKVGKSHIQMFSSWGSMQEPGQRHRKRHNKETTPVRRTAAKLTWGRQSLCRRRTQANFLKLAFRHHPAKLSPASFIAYTYLLLVKSTISSIATGHPWCAGVRKGGTPVLLLVSSSWRNPAIHPSTNFKDNSTQRYLVSYITRQKPL